MRSWRSDARTQTDPEEIDRPGRGDVAVDDGDVDLEPVSQSDPLDAAGIAELAFPSVVYIETRLYEGRGLGSGFFIRTELIVTNNHVIAGAQNIRLKPVGTNDFVDTVEVGIADEHLDLALLKVKGFRNRPLALAEAGQVKAGQKIFALGNPKGLEGTISEGLISSANFRDLFERPMLQISTPVSPGSSSGPVVDQFGRVVGIVTLGSITGEALNLNFAEPVKLLREFLDKYDGRDRLLSLTMPISLNISRPNCVLLPLTFLFSQQFVINRLDPRHLPTGVLAKQKKENRNVQHRKSVCSMRSGGAAKP